MLVKLSAFSWEIRVPLIMRSVILVRFSVAKFCSLEFSVFNISILEFVGNSNYDIFVLGISRWINSFIGNKLIAINLELVAFNNYNLLSGSVFNSMILVDYICKNIRFVSGSVFKLSISQPHKIRTNSAYKCVVSKNLMEALSKFR